MNQSQTAASAAMTTSLEVLAQVQPLTTGDLRQVEALNLQGTHRTIYINGAAAGLVRVTKQGGDLVTLPDGSVWLVTIVPEQWPDWCHAVITLQNDPNTSGPSLDLSTSSGIPFVPAILTGV